MPWTLDGDVFTDGVALLGRVGFAVTGRSTKDAGIDDLVLERTAAAYKAIQDRIRDQPEARDVMVGDALNSTLATLLDPKVSDLMSRFAAVPLDVELMRMIPFKVGESEAATMVSRAWRVATRDRRG